MFVRGTALHWSSHQVFGSRVALSGGVPQRLEPNHHFQVRPEPCSSILACPVESGLFCLGETTLLWRYRTPTICPILCELMVSYLLKIWFCAVARHQLCHCYVVVLWMYFMASPHLQTVAHKYMDSIPYLMPLYSHYR